MKAKTVVILVLSVVGVSIASYFGYKKIQSKKTQENNQGAGE